MITKADIASVLGLVTTDITDSIYNWGKQQFFITLGVSSAEVEKTYRKFLTRETEYIKLPHKNIKSIDSVTVDGVVNDNLTPFTDYKLNPDTGFLWYSTGFGDEFGSLVEVAYTIAAYDHEEIHDYLVSLLVAKALAIFTPEKVQQIRMVKIGKFQKQFGSASANLNEYSRVIDDTIASVIATLRGEDGGAGIEGVF